MIIMAALTMRFLLFLLLILCVACSDIEEHLRGSLLELIPANEFHEKKAKTGSSKPGKRTLVIQIGPMKTGTTHIQGILAHPSTRDVLLEDGFVYIGRMAHEEAFQPKWFDEHQLAALNFRDPRDMLHGRDGPTLKEALSDLYNHGLNAIIVSEYLSGLFWLSNEEATEICNEIDSNWNVQVVGAYRRLYNWLPSLYHQEIRPNTKEIGGRDQQRRYNIWPGQEKNGLIGEPIPPFDLEAALEGAEIAEKFHYMEDSGVHPVLTALSPWKQHIHDVTVFNMDEDFPQVSNGDPYTIFFACNVTRQLLPNTCRAATAGLIGIKKLGGDNPSYPINYDILATSAHEAGLIDPRLSLQEVFGLIKTHHEIHNLKTDTDFPLACPSNQTLERLLNVSLRTELSVYPEKATKEAEAKHREGFAESVAKNKYCSINATEVLQDERWRQYLRSLKP
jgi:hypothetical protein